MRHKGNSKHRSGKGKSKKVNESDDNQFLTDAKRKKLQEDLAKAMLSAAKVSMKACTEKLAEKSTEYQDLINSDDDKSGSEGEEVNSDEHTESSDGDASTDEQKMNKKNCYANGCCNVPYEQSEKVQ